MLELLRACGFHTNPNNARCETIDEVVERRARAGSTAARRCDYEIDGVVVKVDDLDVQARARRGRPRAALGDRLQVPADAGDHAAARHRRQRRAHRQPQPVRRCSSRCRSAASRSSWPALHNEDDIRRKDIRDRRHGHRPARRRGDPAGDRPGAVASARPTRALRVPTEALPGLRHAGRPHRRARRWPTARAASAVRPQRFELLKHFVGARRDGHRDRRAKSCRLVADRAGLVNDLADLYRLTKEQLLDAGADGRQERPERAGQHRGQQAASAGAA